MASVAWFENALGSFSPTRVQAPPLLVTDTARFRRHRTIFISDTHLGTRGCKAELLEDFLAHNECRTLYLVGDNYMDGWALAVSSDEGRTLQPILRYDQVSGVQACAAAACQDSCDEQAGRRIWGPGVCNPLPADAGPDGGPTPKAPSGCGCEAAATRGGAPGIAALFVATLLAAARARRSAATRRRRGRGC